MPSSGRRESQRTSPPSRIRVGARSSENEGNVDNSRPVLNVTNNITVYDDRCIVSETRLFIQLLQRIVTDSLFAAFLEAQA